MDTRADSIGKKYAAQLSALGHYDRALTILEDMAGLAEQSCTFPDLSLFSGNTIESRKCPRVPVTSPLLPDMGAYIFPHAQWKFVDFRFSCSSDVANSSWAGLVQYTALVNYLTKRDGVPTDNFRVPWLDPIRDHPRYTAVVERMQACRDRLTV